MPILTQKTKRQLTKAQLTKKIKKNLGHIIQLDPNSVTFAATSGGTVSDYSPGQTTIKVYQGTGSLTPSSTLASNNTFKVEVDSDTNITAPATLTYGASAVTTNNPSSMTADQAHIDWTVTVKDLTGTEVEYEVKQNFAKARDGVDGVNGTSYLTLTGSVTSGFISRGSLGHYIPVNGNTSAIYGINVWDYLLDEDHDSEPVATTPLNMSSSYGGGYSAEQGIVAAVPSGKSWDIKSITGHALVESSNSSDEVTMKIGLYRTQAQGSPYTAGTMDQLGSAAAFSGRPNVYAISASIQTTVGQGYGLLPVLHWEQITGSSFTNFGFQLTIEFVSS